jgi:hypothetical protein
MECLLRGTDWVFKCNYDQFQSKKRPETQQAATNAVAMLQNAQTKLHIPSQQKYLDQPNYSHYRLAKVRLRTAANDVFR